MIFKCWSARSRVGESDQGSTVQRESDSCYPAGDGACESWVLDRQTQTILRRKSAAQNDLPRLHANS